MNGQRSFEPVFNTKRLNPTKVRLIVGNDAATIRQGGSSNQNIGVGD